MTWKHFRFEIIDLSTNLFIALPHYPTARPDEEAMNPGALFSLLGAMGPPPGGGGREEEPEDAVTCP